MTGEESDQPFQYTGRENDGTGLYYYRARYYSPALQRFISEDPIGFAGGMNWYAYTGNSPMNGVDPLGLWVINNSPYTIYVKPENSSTPVAVPSGGAYAYDQDGFADPTNHPGEVFKTTDDVGAIVNPDGTVSTMGQSPTGVYSNYYLQPVTGGWKGKDWLKKLQDNPDKPDHGWDELFEKSNLTPGCTK